MYKQGDTSLRAIAEKSGVFSMTKIQYKRSRIMNKKLHRLNFLFATLVLGLGIVLPQGANAGHTNTLLRAELDGSSEVASDSDASEIVGDATGTGHASVFGVDGDAKTLCYVLSVSGIQLVPVAEGMAAHIHEGALGENGPVVAALAGPEDGNAADCLTEGEEGKFPMGKTGIVQRILNNPEGFYVNVHNPQFPDGAIRGQLESH